MKRRTLSEVGLDWGEGGCGCLVADAADGVESKGRLEMDGA